MATVSHSAIERAESHYRSLYNHEAPQYDKARFNHSKGRAFHQHEQETIARLIGARPGVSLLDVAAGTGRIAAALAERGMNVTAFDLTRGMLLQARDRAERNRPLPVRFVEGTGRQLPFADNTFEAVISIRFLHLLPANLHQPFVQEMWRVLQPGGTLLVQFDSALAGGVVTWPREAYRQLIRGHKPRYYVWPHQVNRTFAGIDNISLYGFSPIGARALRKVNGNLAAAMESLLADGQRGFLANRVFVRAIKPVGAA